MRRSILIVAAVTVLLFLGGLLAPYAPDASDRSAIELGASHTHWLGTDALGHDRFSRLLFASRTSFLAASVAAAASVGLGLVLALVARTSRRAESATLAVADIVTAVPGFLLVLMLRGSLPLSITPTESLVATFGLLAMLAWPAMTRLCVSHLASNENRRKQDYAAAMGLGMWSTYKQVTLPAIGALAATQFALLLPVFVLAEADLGLLGLGVIEPMTSLGGLLRELVATQGRGGLVWAPVVTTALLVAMVSSLNRRQYDAYR